MDNRKTILATALKLFVENGFHATPTIKIATDAGVANGTLFHYFKTKEDLIVALYLDIQTQMGEALEKETQKGGEVKLRVKSLFLGTLHWALGNRLAFQFLQQFQISPFFKLIAQETIQQQNKIAFELIAEGINANVMKPMPVNYINILMYSQLIGLCQYLMESDFTKEKQKLVEEETFELLWEMVTYRILRFE